MTTRRDFLRSLLLLPVVPVIAQALPSQEQQDPAPRETSWEQLNFGEDKYRYQRCCKGLKLTVYQARGYVVLDGQGCRWVWAWEVRRNGNLLESGLGSNSLECQDAADYFARYEPEVS